MSPFLFRSTFAMISSSSPSNMSWSPRKSLKPSRISSRVRMPSASVSNSLKICRSLSSYCFVFMLLAMYARTAYWSFLSQWKFFNYVRAPMHSGLTVAFFGEPIALCTPWLWEGPPRWNCLIHGSERASDAVILSEGSFCSVFLMRSLAALLTLDHSLP